ncbi:MAG: hypothetical protein JSS02_27180 [Planctomycetes bacterium]|nr:hypothetical protein [Planctomycetota bacterium]
MDSSELAADVLTFDGGRTVTLLQKRAGLIETVTVRGALSSPQSTRQGTSATSLGLVGTTTRWSLNALDVGLAGVSPGDVIDDGTGRWTVLAAVLTGLGSRWRCLTQAQPG